MLLRAVVTGAVVFVLLASGLTAAAARTTGSAKAADTDALGCWLAHRRYVVSSLPTGSNGVMAVAVNPTTGILYSLQTPYDGSRPRYIRVARESAPTNSLASIAVTEGAYTLLVDPLRNLLYVNDANIHSVYVISGRTNKIVATVRVGNEPLNMAIDVERNLIYVAEYDDMTVAVISGSTNHVIAHIPLAYSPGAIAVDPRTHAVYVVNTEGQTGISHPEFLYFGYSLSVIDGVTHRVVDVPVPDLVYDLAVDSSRQTLLALSLYSEIYVLSERTNRVVSSIAVGPTNGDNNPYTAHLVLNERQHRLYVLNDGSLQTSLSVLDETTGAPVGTLAVGENPQGLALDPRRSTAYVAYLGEYYPTNPPKPGINIVSSVPAFTTRVPTTVTVRAANDDFGYGVDLTATVSPAPDGGGMTITDNAVVAPPDGGIVINPKTGVMTATLRYTAAGRHVIIAAFHGDVDFRPASAQLVFTVDASGRIIPGK